MSAKSTIAKPTKNVLLEFKSFNGSSLMKSLHTYGENEPADMQINSEIRKVPFISNQMASVDHTMKSNETVYEFDMGMDYLRYMYLEQNIPTFKVKPQYAKKDSKIKIQISLPHNFFHHTLQNVALYFGKKFFIGYPGKWLDPKSAFGIQEDSISDGYLYIIGDRHELTSWGNDIKACKVGIPLPMPLCDNIQTSIPLFLCKESPPTVRINYRRNILDLLRMRISKDGKNWSDVTNNKAKSTFLVDGDSIKELDIPIMKCRYREIEQAEREYKISEVDNEGNKHYQTAMAYSIVHRISSDPVPAGATYSFETDIPTPIYAVFFNAEHVRTRENNDFSNYTTHFIRKEGSCPIQQVEHLYNGEVIFTQDEMSFAYMMPYYHGLRVPRKGENCYGMGMYSKSESPFYSYPDVGLLSNKELNYTLKFYIKGEDKYIESDDDKVEDEDEDALFISASSNNAVVTTNGDKYYINLFIFTKLKIIYRYGKSVIIDDGSTTIDDE